MTLAPRIVLASQSPRRAGLLRMLGLDIETVPADIDETYRPGEEPAPHAERLSREKVAVVAAQVGGAVVIGSDTVVAAGDEILGKPRDQADAVRMLMLLQGREHEVVTGVAISYNGMRSGVERVQVRFRPFDEATAAAYVETGEPMDKAGAYGIQGFGSTLVEGITGDYYAVMGLPVCRLLRLLQDAGLHYNFRELTTRPH
jgi:septum formation protein